MNRNSVLDLLGVVRAIAVATTVAGVIAVLATFLLALAGIPDIYALIAWCGVFLVFPGVLLTCIAALSRAFIRRMTFVS